MRRLAAVTVLSLALGVTAVVTAPLASASASTPGAYVPLPTAYRVVNSVSGANANLHGALRPGATTTVSLAGHVPASAGAALVSISAVGPTGSGNLKAYAAGTSRPATTDLLFSKGVTSSNTVVVALGSGAHADRFAIANSSPTGSTNLTVDVRGYYVGGTVSTDQNRAAGLLHAVAPTRLLDTATTNPSGIGAGRTVSMTVGHAEAGREYLLISVLGATTTGSIAGYAGAYDAADPQQPDYSDVYFAAKANITSMAIVPTDSTGEFTLINRSSGPARIVVDRVAWAVGGAAATADASQVSAGQRVVNGQSVAAGRVASYTLSGKAGVPLASVSAVVVRLIVASPAVTGSVDAGAAGASSNSLRTLSFLKGQRVSATTVIPLRSGRIDIRNSSKGSLKLYVEVLGFVPTTSRTLPATVDVGRYPNDITTSVAASENVMRAHGCTDAEKFATFVLLDIGAQTISPNLSKTHPGVSLAQTGTAVRIAYPDLVADLLAYLTGYRSCSARSVTVAIGTNTSGVWKPAEANYYAPATRGADWANKVVLPLTAHAPSGVSVWGADDIEAGFDATQYQAADWETAYLNALTAAKNTTPLLFNGSADGCPLYFGSTVACNHGWTQAQIANLAHRGGRVWALPQIYGHTEAVQWANVYRAGALKLHFLGSLTESADSETYLPYQGWVALYRALSVDVSSPPSAARAVDLSKDS